MKPPAPRPTRQELLDFIASRPGKVGKREIARAFNLKGAERDWLKEALRGLKDQGAVERGRGKALLPPGRLPEVSVLRIVSVRRDGEASAVPVKWSDDSPAPKVTLVSGGRGRSPGDGDRVLARVEPIGPGLYRGRVIRVLESGPGEVVGTLKLEANHGRIVPADRRARHEVLVDKADLGGAEHGEVVVAELVAGRMFGLAQGRVVRRLGSAGDPRTFSRIAIAQNDIPVAFPPDALAEAKHARQAPLGDRTDLTEVPLVTIDPEDARDHDDAVFAEPDGDPRNPGGFKVIVAIADVSWYVRPGSALDRAARERGNSAYFPDMVVPMLPERLSADLCSLVEGKPRPCLAATLWLDAEGNVVRHSFVRAMMRSAASLTYGQVQRARDGDAKAVSPELTTKVVTPLYAAYALAAAARDRRAPLAIDMPERKVTLDAGGHIQSIGLRERFDSHRLIEEFMILANVAAAETLERARRPCMYRVHDQPTKEKLDALRDFLDTLDIRLAKGQVIRPAIFNRVLERVAGTPHERLVNEVVLRSQAQAIYAAENIGHFGLNLARYAHFTSPIRRYADLQVHRALVDAGRLGEGGLSAEDVDGFEATAEHITRTERRAMQAERDALDRYVAAFMEARVGETLAMRITGVTRAGLFLTDDTTGATGLAPMSSLGDDYFVFDERSQRIQGRASKRSFRLGDAVEAELAEANPVAGGLLFSLAGAGARGRAPRRPDRRRR
ncbi:ribonuclease R [Desertibaculum subflavum]|uniref:ribonuclease R n=1 Tax=Desertibaculum subflavum TaxID=2268458 RepID=UPI000E66E99C